MILTDAALAALVLTDVQAIASRDERYVYVTDRVLDVALIRHGLIFCGWTLDGAEVYPL